ncbi:MULTISPECIES: TetR/AcrR family transcriptional regulator [unclassified Nocardioides]|uniref:TetR/AcrR family transcriptional regulator n=1 Tax=unclassified Nocardioides TaxID=2615069 RepID=UPI0006FC32F8|nr:MULTISPECIES: TetR/AcrR family transcriptional regulator [unclassified Nocardioides]KRA28034.1 transcriptional regulator [Nocardioides sp. Root614]KRA86009.1 transcriptional regulator [Nocardioides sp. Root682]
MSTDRQPDGRAVRYQHRRPELLGGVTEFVLEHGIANLALRAVAEGVGVSHATLLRHFASKEELLAAVLVHIRTDLAARMSNDPELASAESTAELVARLWELLCEPKEQRQFLLLFELLGRHPARGQGDPDLSESLVLDWIELLVGRLVEDGWTRQAAEPVATLVLAQIRGLQLDLLVTGDRERVDRAMQSSYRLLSR